MSENEPICPEETPCVDTSSFPSVMDMTKNLFRDGGNIVKNAIQGNNTLIDDTIREERWSICQACPRLQENRCLECGCFMKVKVAFITSKCPIDKW